MTWTSSITITSLWNLDPSEPLLLYSKTRVFRGHFYILMVSGVFEWHFDFNMSRVKRIWYYCMCEQRWFRQDCASTQSRQNLRFSLIQAVSQEEPSDRKPDPWPLWMAGHAQLKFVMMECSKTKIRLTHHIWFILVFGLHEIYSNRKCMKRSSVLLF